MNRPSQRQMEALAEFLENNSGIARGLLRTQQAKAETKRKWRQFAELASSLGGVIKDGPAWSKYWSEKKCALKRVCQLQAISMRRTGGGRDEVPQLSPLEQRLVAVMGGQSFATGDSELAVDPFPHTSSQAQHSNSEPSPSILASALPSQAAVEIVVDPEINLDLEEDEPEESIHVQPEPPHVARPREARRRRHRASYLDSEVARFERIEAKRVDAEAQTAQALTNIATSLSNIATAVSEMGRQLAAFMQRQ